MPVIALAGYTVFLALAFGLRAWRALPPHRHDRLRRALAADRARPSGRRRALRRRARRRGAGAGGSARRPACRRGPALDALHGVARARRSLLFAARHRRHALGAVRHGDVVADRRRRERAHRARLARARSAGCATRSSPGCRCGLGLVLLAPNVLSALALLALLLALEIQVRGVEEPYLMRTHGTAYRDYASRTGRFVPGWGRF